MNGFRCVWAYLISVVVLKDFQTGKDDDYNISIANIFDKANRCIKELWNR